jgi:hypothetical protein
VDEATLNTRQRLRSLAGVRSFCQKVGIQIVARNYELSSGEPFKRRDILDVFPLVKHLNVPLPAASPPFIHKTPKPACVKDA